MTPHIVKVSNHWINLTEVLWGELFEWDDHDPEVMIHFRGDLADQQMVTVDAKEFAEAMHKDAEARSLGQLEY